MPTNDMYIFIYLHTWIHGCMHIMYSMLVLHIIHPFISILSDIDECSDGTHNCSQICTNTNGSFICECNHGFQLYFDGATCNGRLEAVCSIHSYIQYNQS